MPEIQEINEFKNDLIRLGNEPEIREQRGEALPNITVPEQESVDDLNALFDESSEDFDIFDEDGLFGDDETDALDEFAADLPNEDSPEDDFSEGFEDLFGSSDEPFTGSADQEVEPEAEDFAEDDFNLPPGLTEGLSEDLDDAAGSDAEPFSGFEDFDTLIDDEEGEDALPGVEEPSEDFDSFDFEDSAFDDVSSEETFAEDDFSESEDFNLADFGDFDAEAEEAAADDTVSESDDDSFGQADFDTDDFGIEDEEPSPGSDDVFGEEADDFDFGDAEDFGDIEDVSDDASLDKADDFTDAEPFNEVSFDADEIDDFGEIEDAGDSGITDFDTDELDADSFGGGMPDFDLDGVSGEAVESAEPEEAVDFFSDEISGFDTDEISSGDDDDFSLEDFSLGDIDGEDIDASEFSLGDLGEEFGVDEDIDSDISGLEGLDVDVDVSEESFGDAYSDENYAIPDDDYIALKKTLGQMPRNLKLIIEELIGEKGLSGENLDKLVQALVSGASAREIGARVSKITGKKVRIPAQYERRTAEEFEKEKESFTYIFRKNFIPMFRTAAITAVVLGLLLFLGFRFIYTPLHAESLYQKGYEEIPLGNNQQANAYFERAFSEWQKKNWFYKYAEAFTENKQYIQAEEKYKQLLAWYPEERQAVLDYAELEYKILGKYPEAESLLNGYLFDNLKDYDARLMLGDTYMEWAREIDPLKYEDARFNYAKLIELYGSRDQLLFRMLRYFIRTDNREQAMNLYYAFRQNSKAVIEPEIYAELAGYLIDNGQLDAVRDILMKARSVKEDIPEIHYQLARYFDIIDVPVEEEKALNAAIWLFENTTPLTRTRKGLLIDSYNRYGMILYEQEKYIDAENFYRKAASNYDEAIAAGQLEPDPKYGKIFSNLGDLSYYISGDYDLALTNFEKAEKNLYSPAILKYKKGYVFYNNEDYRDALVEFYDTAEGFSVDRDLLYATANTLFNRSDYYLAEGYYKHLLDILNKEYSSISYLLIDEIPEHRALLENMMKVSNNLGVTKYRLYERSRDDEKNAEAMVLLTDSIEYYDKLTRNPNTLEAPATVNLSYLNSRAIFYPVPDYRLQIYQDIPKDLSRINF